MIVRKHTVKIFIFLFSVVDCGSLPSILNGIPGTPFNTTFRETVTYNCSSGYILLGSATVSCLASGNWSSRPTCTGKSHNIGCILLLKVNMAQHHFILYGHFL